VGEVNNNNMLHPEYILSRSITQALSNFKSAHTVQTSRTRLARWLECGKILNSFKPSPLTNERRCRRRGSPLITAHCRNALRNALLLTQSVPRTSDMHPKDALAGHLCSSAVTFVANRCLFFRAPAFVRIKQPVTNRECAITREQLKAKDQLDPRCNWPADLCSRRSGCSATRR
jgi:hypothetical protein